MAEWDLSQADWGAGPGVDPWATSVRAPIDRTSDFLRSFAYTQGGAGGSGELKRFLDGLVAKGFTGDDFINGLEKYNQKIGLGYNRGWYDNDTDSYYKYNGNEHVGWWGEQDRMKAIGSGLDLLGKPTGWESLYNPTLAQQQAQRVGEIGTQMQNNGPSDMDDLMDVLKFAGAAGGLYGLGGLIGGAGAAGASGASSLPSALSGAGSFEAGLGSTLGGNAGLGISQGLGASAGGALGGAGSFADIAAGGLAGGIGGAVGVGALPSIGAGGASVGGVGSPGIGTDVIASGSGGGSGGGSNMLGFEDLLPDGYDYSSLLNGSGGGQSAADSLIQSTLNGGSEFGTTSAGGPLANGWQGALANAVNGIPNLPPGVSQALKALGGGTGAAAGSGGSVLSRLFGGAGGSNDLVSLLGLLGGGALDAYGANRQTDALKAISDRTWNAGAPSRGRYEAAMSPGFDIKSIPGLSSAMDTATETYLRKLSAEGGNPAGIGAAPSQTQAYVLGNVGLPAYQNYVANNSSAGGLPTMAGQYGQTATNAANSNDALFTGLGNTVNKLTQPQNQTIRLNQLGYLA